MPTLPPGAVGDHRMRDPAPLQLLLKPAATRTDNERTPRRPLEPVEKFKKRPPCPQKPDTRGEEKDSGGVRWGLFCRMKEEVVHDL